MFSDVPLRAVRSVRSGWFVMKRFIVPLRAEKKIYFNVPLRAEKKICLLTCRYARKPDRSVTPFFSHYKEA